MADLKPSTAPLASALDGTELIPCTQGGASKALTPAQIRTLIQTLLTELTVDNVRIDGDTVRIGGALVGDILLKSTHDGYFLVRAGNDSGYIANVLAGVYTAYASGNPAGKLGVDLELRSGGQILVSSSSSDATQSKDVGQKRDSAGTWIDTDASTGVGKRLTGRVVEANTAVAAGPNVLLAIESRKLLTNEGATALNVHSLPPAAAGLEYKFYVQDADGIRVVADTGDTIRIAASVSAAAGRIDSTTIGSAVTLVAINATEWIATSSIGTWTVT